MIKIARRLKAHRLLLAKHWNKEVWERRKMGGGRDDGVPLLLERSFFFF